jgi:hypothetical protein
MKRMIWNVSILLVTAVAVDAQSPQTSRRAGARAEVEEIYVGRSVSESRIAPTEFCDPARTGLANPAAEGRYSVRSISINASDGRVLDPNIKRIGSGHGCYGPTVNGIRKVYAELMIGSKTFMATGECRQKSDFPERGINEFHCSADLSTPDDQYVGGLMTTSSISSLKDVGLETDPLGYTQSSIAIFRIWKKRSQR